MNESIARIFRTKYKVELRQLYLSWKYKVGHFFNKVDDMVQRNIQAASKIGVVISREVAVSTTKALI